MKKKDVVFVTGGSGFIGTNLIKILQKKKIIVHNIDKFSYCSVPQEFTNFNKKNYFFHNIDLRNKKKIRKILTRYNPKYILNLAAESHVDRSIDSPSSIIMNNIEGTLNLLDCLRIEKKKLKLKKLIHVSTDEVYGGNNFRPSRENDKYETNSPYSASKASTDHICQAYWKTYGLPISIVNCCNNFGPYQFPEKFIPTIITSLQSKKHIPIYGKGKNIREWIFVDDFCKAIILVAKKGILGQKYNIGSGKKLSNKQLVFKIICEIKKYINIKVKFNRLIKLVKDRPGHDFKYSINSNKIKSKLKWKPLISLKKGIATTVKWYFNNKEWLQYCKKNYSGKRLGIND